MKKTTVCLILISVALAACSPSIPSAPAVLEQPPVIEPSDPAYEAEMRLNIRRALAKRLKLPIEQIQIVSVEEVEWGNSCLEVQIFYGEMCTDVITPGYRIILLANGQKYEYHTNREQGKGFQFRQVPLPDEQATIQALVSYFMLLHTGNYTEAVGYYGGSYEVLQDWNPDVAPSNYALLFERGCTQNGLQCLEVLTATLLEKQESTYTVLVEFANPDGSLFVRGACCGASPTDMPDQWQFTFTVQKIDGQYRVMGLPVYVP